MSKNLNIVIAGFGGQGVLFTGKVIAYAGLIDGKEVSWLPSYGPEMRGGTANCSVCVSDVPIGSPLVVTPNAFVAMNLPSFDKFINDVTPGGGVVVESSLVSKQTDRTDVKAFYVPATKLAEEHELQGLANIILLGKLFKETQFSSFEALEKAVAKCGPPSKQHLLEPNMRAVKLGYSL
jgi:2-oxoglutarate ferredoxin oxidoreductase subunit gamma